MKRFLSQLGTITIVTAVTVLVWLYAEDANIEEYVEQSVRLKFGMPGESEGLITPGEPISVLVSFDGSNGQYQQFDELRDKPFEIILPFDQALDLQTIDVDIRDQIIKSQLGKLGINVTSVSPERVSVRYEKIIDVPLAIRVRQRTGPIKLSSVNFTDPDQQPRVVLRMPASQAKSMGNAQAIAWINEEDVASLPKGTPQQMTVPLELPEPLAAMPRSTSSVDLLVTVADDRDKVVIDRRPILLSYPPSINERYILEIEESDRFITAFELEGPRDQIAQLKADPASKDVWASVRLSNADADAAVANGGVMSKPVDIIAPRGVVLSSDVVRISIRVIPRQTPTP